MTSVNSAMVEAKKKHVKYISFMSRSPPFQVDKHGQSVR